MSWAPQSSAQAASSSRKPSTTSNLSWLAHQDNPLLNGGSHEFMNTDLAFSGDYAIQGNFDGFSVWDISDPSKPELTSVVKCAGGQGDVSVVGNLVIFSVDETMANNRCDAERVPETATHWDGIRIFDISDPKKPTYVSSVQTRCGSHTNTLVPSGKPDLVYVYVSAYSRGASTTCTGRNPLQIISVPLGSPKDARVAGEIDLFQGRDAYDRSQHVAGQADTRSTTGCHDITVFGNRAAAACRGDGLFLDISNPLKPVVLSQVRDKEMSFWHSAIFTNDGKNVIFQDEMGDGMVNACSSATSSKRGADAIYSVEGKNLTLTGYYKIPRAQSDSKRCTSHNGNVVPVEGKQFMVQAWYEGGISLIDMTDTSKPKEIGYAEWPAYESRHEFTAGIWSAYYYNGHIYASDMWGGFDVFKLNGNEFADADRYASTTLNPQNQPTYAWVWKKEPTLPADRSKLAKLELSRTEFASATADDVESRTLSVSTAAGSFTPGDHVDIWMLGSSKPLSTAIADEAGGLAEVKVTLPADLKAGTYDLVARADLTPTAMAWGALVVSSAPPVALIVAISSGSLLILLLVALLIRKRIRRLRRGRRASVAN
ncbi:MAG: hypothetical protein RLZZ600_1121 [Actinomycetota bacterium]